MFDNIIEDLKWRGLLNDITSEEEILKLPKGSVVYGGFDPSAPSLQIGNLVAILNLARFASYGFNVIGLYGGATGAIGDPKAQAERVLQSMEQVKFNVNSQKRKLTEIYERLGVKVDFVNNYDWFKSINFLEFLRDVGKHFSVGYMTAKDTVKKRLETIGISYAEFSYMLIQAYDYCYLFEKKNCVIQIGGSDQWGNITSGVELIRRKHGKSVHALTTPLLTDAEGKKLGKSEGGFVVWLDENYLSPYKFYQWLLNTQDDIVIKLLKALTFLSKEEIEALEVTVKENPEKREAQKVLAKEVTTIVHGEAQTELAIKASNVLFGGSIEGLDEKSLIDIFSDVPSSSMNSEEVKSSTASDLFVKTHMASSKGEIKRLIQNGGAYINNQKLGSPDSKLSDIKLQFNNIVILRSGKKSYHLIKISD